MPIASNQSDLIGNTALLKIPSLSEYTGCEILAKCEHLNPGGSVKDRASLNMVKEAMARGDLKSGMTIVEGTAGNTGIGLALVAKSLGFPALIVMPKGQATEKERMISLFGAELKLVDPAPFSNPNHFYHTAQRIAEENPKKYWWANQFENLSNFRAHYQGTGPEILEQTNNKVDAFVSVAGTGGTIAGVSNALKEKLPNTQIHLVDPEGSGLLSYLKSGMFEAKGSSITEGIGIMRLVANFKEAKIDDAFSLPDQDLVSMAYFIRDHDGIVLGSSGALNLAGALKLALKMGPGKRIVTTICDLGERSFSKLYNADFLKEKGLTEEKRNLKDLSFIS